VQYYLGRYAESERFARQALDINPHDPETLAQLGWRLSARGNFQEGVPLLRRAMTRSVNPPGWYYTLIAIDHFQKGQVDQMLAVAERSAADGTGVSQMLMAVAAAELGDVQRTRKALEKMALHADFSRDPAVFLRMHGLIETVNSELMQSLEKAKRLASGSCAPSGKATHQPPRPAREQPVEAPHLEMEAGDIEKYGN
jgi:tetratricopeptide (TPR) repeat protein